VLVREKKYLLYPEEQLCPDGAEVVESEASSNLEDVVLTGEFSA